MNLHFDYTGRTVVVTGAAQGIGRELALLFHRSGAHVAVADRNPDALEASWGSADERVRCVELDVADAASGAALVERTLAWTGRVDVLVNNAGIAIRKPALDLTEADWDAVLDVNLRGVFFVAQAVGRLMRDQEPQGGAIVNVASIMGLVGSVERAAYGASKGGVVNLTRMLAVEWAPIGIRVNAVCPTFVDTELTRPMFEARPEYHAEVLERTPLGRLAAAGEVADAVVYLASAPMTTGHALAVDGGWVAQ